MSEVTQEVAPVEGQSSHTETELAPEQLLARVRALEESKNRILQESKSYKEQANAFKQKADSYERKDLEQQGKYQELLKKAEDEKMVLEATLANKRKEALKSQVSFLASKYASDAHDVSDIVSRKEFWEGVEIDESTETVNEQSVRSKIDQFRKEKTYLFKKGSLPAQINNNPAPFREQKSVSEMNKGEMGEALRSSLAALLSK